VWAMVVKEERRAPMTCPFIRQGPELARVVVCHGRRRSRGDPLRGGAVGLTGGSHITEERSAINSGAGAWVPRSSEASGATWA
jgi:hypothetical protein